MIINKNSKPLGNYNAIFFDLDGTLLQSGEGVINAVNYMFERMGIKENDQKRLRAFIGPPVKHQLINVYGLDEQQADKAYGLFREYYLNKGVYESRLYKGVEEMIKSLYQSGARIYIATCKRENMVSPILSQYGLLDCFSGIFGAFHDNGIYDKTQVLQNAMLRLNGLPDDSIMVGDRSCDIIGGKAVGLDTAGVLYGYGDYEELVGAGCDYLLESVDDIPKLAGGGCL